jgi:hypothetical protein
MNNPTDPAARLVFDFGNNVTSVSVTEIKVEELTTTITSVEEQAVPITPWAYPNPVTSILYIDNLDSYDEAIIHDVRGQRLLRFVISPAMSALDLESVAPGFYVLTLRANGRHDYVKVVKE